MFLPDFYCIFHRHCRICETVCRYQNGKASAAHQGLYSTISTTFDAVQFLPEVFDNVNHKNLAVMRVFFSVAIVPKLTHVDLHTNQQPNGFLTWFCTKVYVCTTSVEYRTNEIQIHWGTFPLCKGVFQLKTVNDIYRKLKKRFYMTTFFFESFYSFYASCHW